MTYHVIDRFRTVYNVSEHKVRIIKTNVQYPEQWTEMLTLQMNQKSLATANIVDPDWYDATALAEIVEGKVIEPGPKRDDRYDDSDELDLTIY